MLQTKYLFLSKFWGARYFTYDNSHLRIHKKMLWLIVCYIIRQLTVEYVYSRKKIEILMCLHTVFGNWPTLPRKRSDEKRVQGHWALGKTSARQALRLPGQPQRNVFRTHVPPTTVSSTMTIEWRQSPPALSLKLKQNNNTSIFERLVFLLERF